MAVNYLIHADVIDIRQDVPKPDDIFFVDTNVWYWLAYTRASQSTQPYQIHAYPSYIGNAISVRSQLHRCGLSLAELAHLIEKTEWEIYIRSNGNLRNK